MANTPQPSFMNRLKQFNPFTRKNNGTTVPSVEGPSFFNRINPFKKNNTVKNNGPSFFNRINPFKKNNSTFVNTRGGKRNRKSRKSRKSRRSRR
jgi:hypothetical protein